MDDPFGLQVTIILLLIPLLIAGAGALVEALRDVKSPLLPDEPRRRVAP